MARVTSRIPWSYRSVLFAVLLISWVSGVTFFSLDTWGAVEGDFGPEKHPWQNIFLRIHGGAAFGMMIIYGYLLASHVPASWKTRRFRKLGLTLVGAQGFLIVTAYLLYYLGSESAREVVRYAHASVGFLFPFLLTLHVASGIRFRKSRKKNVPQKKPPAGHGGLSGPDLDGSEGALASEASTEQV